MAYEITRSDLVAWWKLWRQLWNGYHLEPSDMRELVRLNYLVMEVAHKIHNDDMLSNRTNNNETN